MLKIGGLYLSRLHFILLFNLQELGYIVSLSNNIKSDCLAAKEPLLKVFHFLKKKRIWRHHCYNLSTISSTVYIYYFQCQYISTISTVFIHYILYQCLSTISCTSIHALYLVKVYIHNIQCQYLSTISSASVYPLYPVTVYIHYIQSQYLSTISCSSIYPLNPVPVYIQRHYLSTISSDGLRHCRPMDQGFLRPTVISEWVLIS